MSVVLPPRADVGRLGPVGRPFPIVPEERGGGRALVAVIAILAFLAALAAGSAALVVSSAAGWRAALTDEATIQLRPLAGRDEEADLARAVSLAGATPGIRSAAALSRQDAERLLEPWLGAGLDLSELPVPRLVALRLDPSRRPDLSRLALRLKIELPGASLDDHSAWLARLGAVTAGAVLAASGTVVLVLLASAGAVAFATRGVVAGHRDVVEVLHFVGATPGFVARLFARRFARLGLAGGTIGALAAAVLLGTAVVLSGGGPSGAPGLFGTGLVAGPSALAAILLVVLADGAVAGLVTAWTVKRFLKATA